MFQLLQAMWFILMSLFLQTDGGGKEGTEEEEEEIDVEEEEDDDEEDESVKDPKARIRALEEEKTRHAKKAKRAERERDDVMRRLKEYEDAEKTDSEKQSEELQELQSNLKDATDQLDRAEKRIILLQNDEIVSVPGKRRDYVIKMVIDDLEIDEDGESNLSDLLTNLKKTDPFLFGKLKEGEEEDDDQSGPPAPKTGTGRKSKGSELAASRRAMADRFPALQKRAPGVTR